MPVVDVDASLVGVSSLTSEASLALSVTATPAGSSDLSASPAVVRGVDASLSGSSTLSAPLLLNVLSASLAGSSTFNPADPSIAFIAQAILVGGSTLAAALNVVVGPVATVRYSAPSRRVDSSKMVFDQVDLFLTDGKTRAQDVQVSDLALRVFHNGTQLNWSLVSGAGIPDVRVAAGKVYWTEISTGFYSLRFFPNAVGEWRVLVTYPAHDQAVSFGYDVVPQAASAGGLGLRASFVRR